MLPAAVSGIVAAFIIAVSRAIGETMVATMAGGYDGAGPYNGLNPLNPGLSMTAAMTNAAGGTDQTQGGAAFEVLFFVGLLLFLITLGLNLVGDRFVAARPPEVLMLALARRPEDVMALITPAAAGTHGARRRARPR